MGDKIAEATRAAFEAWIVASHSQLACDWEAALEAQLTCWDLESRFGCADAAERALADALMAEASAKAGLPF